MSSVSNATPPEPTATTRAGAPSARTGLPWWGFGLANTAVILVLSIASWWLLIDPAWSVLGAYPQPYTAMLFWTIVSVVWIAFTFGWLGPAGLAQPLRGLVGVALSLVIGIGITLLLAYGYGRIDPTFAAGRAGGAGFTTGNLFVLFAFFSYVIAVVNWGQWPWAGRIAPPLAGVAEVRSLALPTLILYAVFVLPNLATWAVPGTAAFSVPTLIGWFYSVIVAVVVTGVLIENWPWRLAGSGGRVALASTVGNVLVGTVIYYIDLTVAKLLMGGADAATLGAGVTVHAAELGVCWVIWMILWANVFGNRPAAPTVANYGIRIAVTYVLGMVTYLVYYFWFSGTVLHEPVVAGGMHGDALGFVDLLVLWTLWYVLFFGSWGLPPMRTDEETAPADHRVATTDA